MTYDEIFNRFYNLMDDPNFYKLPQDFAYDRMRSWLHDAASKPYIRKKFSQLKLDDRLLELTYSLNNPSDQESDDDFVINIFAQYMVIGWLKPQVDNAINTARIIGSTIALTQGAYSGFMDTKNIKQESFNWLRSTDQT